jgi:hypothetical protein
MSCANEAWSTTVVGSQPSLWPDEHSNPVTTPSCRKTETYQHKNSQRMSRDHAHTNPEHVWGDEGPINDRREAS